MQEHGPSYNDYKAMNNPNFMLKTHVPQRQILKHEKTRLFITNCGANGVLEALYYGVPIIGFPKVEEQKDVA